MRDQLVGSGQSNALMGTLYARVPVPTVEDLARTERAEAEADVRFWNDLHGGTMKLIELHEGTIAHASKKSPGAR
jgi:hypothetical protein